MATAILESTRERINEAYLLRKTLWLMIILNLHIYKKDEFESKPKGTICLCTVVPIPIPSLNCDLHL